MCVMLWGDGWPEAIPSVHLPQTCWDGERGPLFLNSCPHGRLYLRYNDQLAGLV